MILQYIGRSALIGSLLFTLLMMVAPLAAEQGKTEREIRAAELTRVVRDAIANDIAQLGGAKIGKLATHLDVTIPDKAYSCLCRTYPRSGHVGVKAEGAENQAGSVTCRVALTHVNYRVYPVRDRRPPFISPNGGVLMNPMVP